jgi:membrane associated rhomboid family serine protease
MEGEIDYTEHTEPDLVEMFGRLDPRYAAEECARLGRHLTELGYVVTEGETGPGFAEPSPTKLQVLIGSSRPFECAVEFGNASGTSTCLEEANNDFKFVGSGSLRTDGIRVCLSGQVGTRGRFPCQDQVELPWRQIVDVERQGSLVRFAYSGGGEDDGAMTLRLSDDTAAAALVAVLPKTRRKGFRPQIKANANFETLLTARSPRTPVTFGIIAINAVLLIATLVTKADWWILIGNAQIGWGSNFGPYTTDGDWWRLLTALFVHFGFFHLFFNMVALAWFGPLVERLYGSINFLLLYLLAGISGSLASVAWHPDVNSAGASGAIVGILGALLAAQLRAGDSFPSDILRSIRHATLVFLGWVLYVSFTRKGVDYAAHLGGFASGFVLGLAAARPIVTEKFAVRSQLRGLLFVIPVGSALLAGGAWWAQRAADSLVRDGLYFRTVHWIHDLIEALDKTVIPFWRGAGDRLSAIHLLIDSPNRASLKNLQNAIDARAAAFQLLDDGLQKDDPKVVATARLELKEIDQATKE